MPDGPANTVQSCNCLFDSHPVAVLMFDRTGAYAMYYPEGMKARVIPMQSIEPDITLAPTRDSNQEPPGPHSTVQSSNHYNTTAISGISRISA